jgi:hypothetical protein
MTAKVLLDLNLPAFQDDLLALEPSPKFQGVPRINRMKYIAKLEKLTSDYWEHP